jgi:hypothetical protein
MDIQNIISFFISLIIFLAINYLLFRFYKRRKNQQLMDKRAAEIALVNQREQYLKKQVQKETQEIKEGWNAFRNEMIFAKNRYKNGAEIIKSVNSNHSEQELIFIVGHEFFFKFEEILKKQWFNSGTEGHHLVKNNVMYMVNCQIEYFNLASKIGNDPKDFESFLDQRPSNNESFLIYLNSELA